VEELRRHDAIRIAPAAELKGALAEMLASSAESRAVGARARTVFESEAGATERAVQALIEVLEARALTPVHQGSGS
jgi:3-deoxy-D-manno-octulosonic-acid transferase